MESSVVCSWSRYKYASTKWITKHVQGGIIRQHSIPNLYGKVKTVFIYRKSKYVTASLIKFINMKCDEEELLDNKRLI